MSSKPKTSTSKKTSKSKGKKKNVVGQVYTRRAELEGMGFRKQLLPLAKKYKLKAGKKTKKNDVIDMILRHETVTAQAEEAAAKKEAKKKKREQVRAAREAARKRKEAERNKQTGFNRLVQARIDTKTKQAKRTRVLDLTNSTDPWTFNLGLRDIPKAVIEVFKQKEIDTSKGLRQLWLTHNQIKTLRDETRFLRNLRVLGLSHNEITELPPAVMELKMLETLHVADNKLRKLPEALAQMTSLREIDVSGNKFELWPDVLCDMYPLEVLKIARNKLRTVPTSIKRMRNLVVLDLDHNYLPEVPHAIWRLAGTLTSLGLAHNHLAEEPDCVPWLSNIVELRLEGNRAHKYEVRHPLSGLVMPDVVMPFRLVDGVMQTREGKHGLDPETGQPVYFEENLEGYVDVAISYTQTNARWFLKDDKAEYDMIRAKAKARKKRLKREKAKAAKPQKAKRTITEIAVTEHIAGKEEGGSSSGKKTTFVDDVNKEEGATCTSRDEEDCC